MDQETYPVSPETSTERPSIFDDDKPLPLYYAEQSIFLFSIFFGALFGSILMAMNLNRNEGKKGKMEVIVFGILFTVLQYKALQYLPKGSYVNILFGLLSGLILKAYFWKTYIGSVPYTKRSIVAPLIIGLTIFIALLGITLYSLAIQ